MPKNSCSCVRGLKIVFLDQEKIAFQNLQVNNNGRSQHFTNIENLTN